MNLKYIQLFEEYNQTIKSQIEETGHTWSQIRDAIQTRLPYVIITFTTRDSYLTALNSYFKEYDYIKQTAALSKNGKLVDYPSIVIILDNDVSFKNKIQNIFNQFKIKSIILGKKGEEEADVYYQDGTVSPAGNEIVSTNQLDDMDNDPHFKIGSTYYKFIDFAD